VIVFGNDRGGKTKYRVIGIVGNEHQMGPDSEQHAEFYLPSDQLRSMILVARTVRDPLTMASAVKQQVWNIDKDQPVSEVGTEEGALREWVAPRRFNMTILLKFAGIALVLATVGLYSVLAYSVMLRTREIGIRIALGAEPGAVTVLIVRQGAAMALIGIAIGLCGAFALTRFMQSLIFGVNPVDPPTFVAVSLLLIAVSVVASYIPALRAARIDPIEALRVE
jgi:putative ABC transport system permease protein